MFVNQGVVVYANAFDKIRYLLVSVSRILCTAIA